ncbi:hypothetical protein B4N89_32280 [Embleya scabrispora]|uniref:Uncharacterized protein n=1 Tax=Embleya scabrispora TaxID=159449 RepID=A0A1T3NPS6_9ACTN|nr:hypothetical protein B4N89_32280 [Embleya scabrispora]
MAPQPAVPATTTGRPPTSAVVTAATRPSCPARGSPRDRSGTRSQIQTPSGSPSARPVGRAGGSVAVQGPVTQSGRQREGGSRSAGSAGGEVADVSSSIVASQEISPCATLDISPLCPPVPATCTVSGAMRRPKTGAAGGA